MTSHAFPAAAPPVSKARLPALDMQVMPLQQLDLAQRVGPGDRVLWGQACAEPRALVHRLMQQRHAIARGGRFSAFLGVGAPGGALDPSATDCIDFLSYCGTGANRALSSAGQLDILPSHYSHMAAMLADGRLRTDVLLLQVAPGSAPGTYSFSLAQEYLSCALEQARVVIAVCNAHAPRTHGA